MEWYKWSSGRAANRWGRCRFGKWWFNAQCGIAHSSSIRVVSFKTATKLAYDKLHVKWAKFASTTAHSLAVYVLQESVLWYVGGHQSAAQAPSPWLHITCQSCDYCDYHWGILVSLQSHPLSCWTCQQLKLPLLQGNNVLPWLQLFYICCCDIV